MNRLSWTLEVYSPCEYRSGEIDYEKCSHDKGVDECRFGGCSKYYLEQINAFKEEIEERGFKLSFEDRGKEHKLTISSGRYELWLESHCQYSKIYFCQTLEALCKFGIPRVKKEIETREPGRYSDPL